MKFKSTRDSNVSLSAKEVLLKGISDEGGLFVPEQFPALGNINNMMDMEYRDLFFYICGKFLTDFSPQELAHCVDGAYNITNFSNPNIAPIRKLSDRYVLELFYGRTSAFKDMALSVLPYFVEVSMKDHDNQNEIAIITATSGDTGKAALEGFKDIPGIKIIVLFPEDGVSSIQKLQMQSQEGDNVYVLGVKGNFDDCQRAAKDIFTNDEIKKSLMEKGIELSSANSINFGRLLPQVIYYFSAYINMLKYGEIQQGEMINVVVPTGNFGNILACYYAKRMGLPVKNLICASNENKVLTDFIRTGTYDANRKLETTTTPSMDILISSNLERFIYHISKGDTHLINQLMESLKEDGKYSVSQEIMDEMNFVKGYFATQQETENKIFSTYINERYLMDPHTAVASHCYDQYVAEHRDYTKTLIVSTASPYKFTDAILDALKIDTKELDDFQKMDNLSTLTGVVIPDNLSGLKGKDIRFTDFTQKEEITSKVLEFITGEKNA